MQDYTRIILPPAPPEEALVQQRDKLRKAAPQHRKYASEPPLLQLMKTQMDSRRIKVQQDDEEEDFTN